MNLHRPALGLLLTLLLAACASTAKPVTGSPGGSEADLLTAQNEARAEEDARLPKVEMNEDLLFGLLASEYAAQNGQTAAAASTYLELAQEVRDPRLARRAAELSLVGGNLNMALASLSLWSALDPESEQARLQLALALARTGRLAEARPLFDSLLSVPSRAPALFSHIAVLAPRQADKQGNYEVVQELAQRFPTLPESRFALSASATEVGADAVADQAIHQLASSRPDWVIPVMWRVERLRALRPALAAPFLKQALADRPKSPLELQLSYPRLLVADRQYDQARAEFTRLDKRNPNNPDILYAIGILDYEHKDYDDAERHLKAASAAGYRDPAFILLTLGQMEDEQKRPEQARAYYEQVGQGAYYPQAQARIASLEAQSGQLNAALARIEKLGPDLKEPARLELWRAQLARDAGQQDRAYAILSTALRKYPAALELWYERGILADQLGRPGQAESDLRHALKLDPDSMQTRNALGYTLANRGIKLAEARQLIEKALADSPDNGMVMDSMGWVLFRQGRLTEAYDWLQRAYAALPDGEIAAHMIEVLVKQGKLADARALAANMLTLHPDSDVLAETVKRLKVQP